VTQRPLLLHVFPTFAVGGAQARFADIANHFGDAARHIVVALDGRTGAREKLSPGLDVRITAPPQGVSTPRAIRYAYGALRRTRPDVLVTSNWGAIDWAIARLPTGIRHVHTEDGFGPEEQDRQLPRRVFTRRAVLRFSDVVLPSRTLLDIASNQWRLNPTKLQFIPNGIDTARFAAAAPAELPPGHGAVIGTIAALRPEKNIGRLLQAFAQLRTNHPARLVIVGDGPQRTELEALAASLHVDDTVHFAGHSATPERYLAAFDIFALSSDTEQMPLSLLEAMAAGLPVAATDVGDVRNMVATENRPFVVPRDTAALAGALLALTGNGMRAREIGARNAAEAGARFSQARMFEAFGRLLGI
jgi:glycosyltransferase involved in cell wall biosynthesis